MNTRLPMYSFPPKQKALVLGETIEFVSAGSGTLTVVLVNGSGGPIEGWYKVFGALAEFAKVFAYNRPGVGGSSKPRVPQVGSHAVSSLRATLRAANLSPPYVLVGHSLGGLIVNLFARLHPSEVAAAILVEATAANDISVLPKYENTAQRFLKSMLEKVAPPNPNAEAQHVRSTVTELELAPPFPAIPLNVITGGKPAMAWATAPKAIAARTAGQQELVSLSPLGKQTMAAHSGHFPQFTEPQLVIAAVAEAVNPSFKRPPDGAPINANVSLQNMNRNIALILVKIVLTLPVTYALAYPFLNQSEAGGVFKEVEMLGMLGSVDLVEAAVGSYATTIGPAAISRDGTFTQPLGHRLG